MHGPLPFWAGRKHPRHGQTRSGLGDAVCWRLRRAWIPSPRCFERTPRLGDPELLI